MIQVTKHGRLNNGKYGIAFIRENGIKDGAIIDDSGNIILNHYVFYKLSGNENKLPYNDVAILAEKIQDVLNKKELKEKEELEKNEKYLIDAIKRVFSLKTAKQVGGYILSTQNKGRKTGIPSQYWLQISRRHTPSQLKVSEVRDEYKKSLLIYTNRLPKNFKVPENTKKYRIEQLFKNKRTLAKQLPNTGYSMGELKRIYANDVLISCYNNTNEYAKSRKYKAKHGQVNVYLSLKDAYRLRAIANILTIPGELIGRGVRTARWIDGIALKYDSSVTWVNGYLAGDYHFVAENDKSARVIAKKYYADKKANEIQRRKYTSALKRNNLKTFVGYNDSRNAGNCEVGTKGFALHSKIKLNEIGAIRADLLIKLAEKHNVISYANKAIEQAKLRYSGILATTQFENEL